MVARYRIYEENPEFHEYTIFDNKKGTLLPLTSKEYNYFITDDNLLSIDKSIYKQIKIDENYMVLNNPNKFPTHTRFPRRVYFQICHHCNLNCDFCFIKARNNEQFVPTEYIIKFANYFSRKGLMEVRLTGGEPLLHPDFFKILHYFQDLGIFCSIATNGVWHNSTLDQLIKEKNIWCIVSIEGSKKVHNKLRKGTYDIILRNLSKLREKSEIGAAPL